MYYSDTKAEAGRAKVDEVKTSPAPDAAAERAASIWKQREEDYKRRHPASQVAAARQGARAPSEPYYGDKPDTDASKCTLARDIVAGRARHMNGKPTDAYDRDVANSDIKNFCR